MPYTQHLFATSFSDLCTLFFAKTIHALSCHKKNLCTLFLSRTWFMHFFGENDSGTSSGKFLRVESCHPESSDFLGLCCTVSAVKQYLEPFLWKLNIVQMNKHQQLGEGEACLSRSKHVRRVPKLSRRVKLPRRPFAKPAKGIRQTRLTICQNWGGNSQFCGLWMVGKVHHK